jgi:hypothetical protein
MRAANQRMNRHKKSRIDDARLAWASQEDYAKVTKALMGDADGR